jgi:hypothetical protein
VRVGRHRRDAEDAEEKRRRGEEEKRRRGEEERRPRIAGTERRGK